MTRIKFNLISSVIAHLIRYAAPLLALPYLTRTIGLEGFAQYAILLAAGQALGQVVEFGYGLQGAKDLSSFTPGNGDTKQLTGRVLTGRTINFTLVAAALSAALLIPDFLGVSEALAIASIAVGYGFSPSWFYIGSERAYKQSFIDLATAFSTLILTVALVRSNSPPYYACIAVSAPLISAAVLGNLSSIRKLGFKAPSFAELYRSKKESLSIFLMISIPSLSMRGGLLVLGHFSSPAQVSFFALSEKIVSACFNASTPAIRVLLPRINRAHANKDALAILYYDRSVIGLSVFYFACTLTAIAIVASSSVIPFIFGQDMTPAGLIICVMLAGLPFSITAKSIGLLGLMTVGRESIYRNSIVASAILYLSLAPISAIFIDALGMALLKIITDIALCLFIIRASTNIVRRELLLSSKNSQ